jgi:hypothetical protein
VPSCMSNFGCYVACSVFVKSKMRSEDGGEGGKAVLKGSVLEGLLNVRGAVVLRGHRPFACHARHSQ